MPYQGILEMEAKDLGLGLPDDGGVYSGPVAGVSLCLNQGGRAIETVNFPNDGYYRIEIMAAAEPLFGEWVRMGLELDGAETDARLVAAPSANVYTFVRRFNAGARQIAFTFSYNFQDTTTLPAGNLPLLPTENTYPDGGKCLYLGHLHIEYLETGIVRTVPSPQYATIQAAINASAPGDKVIVKAGTYNEQLEMREGVILMSDPGQGGDVEVPNSLDDNIAMTNGEMNVGVKPVLARAQRTIIDGTGFPGGTAAKPMVNFPEGITEATILDGFAVTNMPAVDHTKPGHAHTLQNRGSSPTIVHNIVFNNGTSGIGSHCTFIDDNNHALGIKSFAHPIIEGNVSFKNSGAGFGNNHYSYASLRNNESFGNYSLQQHDAPGIGIQHGAHPLVEGNLSHHNDWPGIGSRHGVNEPVIPGGPGLNPYPWIRKNTCYRNGLSPTDDIHGAGIGADNAGDNEHKIVIEENICYENSMAGIGLRNGSVATVRRNECYANQLAGIGMNQCASDVLVKENHCYNNRMAGIGCKEGSTPIIFGNRCEGNHESGIGLDMGQARKISRNYSSQNDQAGIGLVESKAGEISGNELIRNGTVGIGLRQGSQAEIITGNLVRQNGKPGIAVFAGAWVPSIVNNILEGNGRDNSPNMMLRESSGEISLVNNTLTQAAGPQPHLYLAKVKVCLDSNVIANHSNVAVVAENSAEVTAVRNLIYRNEGAVFYAKQSKLTLYHNTLHLNSQARGCALVLDESEATTRNNIFSSCRMAIGGQPTDVDEDYNCYYETFLPPMYGTGSHSLKDKNPKFVNPGQPDLRLAPGSPCINRGVHIAGVNDNYQGSAPDMGAWEA